MNKLLELTENFTVSRPVFELSLDSDGRNIDARTRDPIYRYQPTPIPDDCLSSLVCEHYEERFDIHQGQFVINKNEIATRAMQEIRQSIKTFIEKNIGMRNPRQSKLYRWAYRNMPNHLELNEVLVMVYKYMCSFCYDNMVSNDQNHTNNTIALLEAIMEKHEQ